jgi:uncharacterized membrane protein HdeD (DUF308 family)
MFENQATTTPRAARPIELIEARTRDMGWAMALRGLLAVIFGIIAVRYPTAAAGAFIVIFAVWAFADGVLDLVEAFTFARMGLRWGWYLFEGIVSIAAGVVALSYPHVTFTILAILIGIRAIAGGILELAAAFSWRELESRWPLALTGVLSIVLGVLLCVAPTQAGLTLLWMIGVYAIVFGVMLFVHGVRLAGRGGHRGAMMGHAAPA